MKHKFANNGTLPANLRLNQLRYDVKKKYGLSLEETAYLRSQQCEICGQKASKMCIDHKIPKTYRGVLCQQCNTRLGWFEKHIDVILDYVERGPQNATYQKPK
jgi:Recombination endonuclease VII